VKLSVVSTRQVQTNAYYRALFPMAVMKSRGHTIIANNDGGQLPFDQLREVELVHFYRLGGPPVMKLVKALQRLGIAITWDNDDSPYGVPETSPHYKDFVGLRGQRDSAAQAQMVRRADVVTTPSARLAEMYRRSGATDVRVIENCLPPSFLSAPKRPHDGIVIGWVAAAEHLTDVKRMGIDDVLRRLMNEHPNVRVETAGVNLGLSDRYRHYPVIPFQFLSDFNAGLDIGIAPLVDTPFNRARSSIKVKEYSATGVPWLASPVGPYVRLGSEQGGQLVADDDWYDALDHLIRHPRERRRRGKRAKKWAKSQAMLADAGDLWEQAFRDAIEHARTEHQVHSVAS
jgi:glycosyltransferase involved in cell wall biosynthesis